MPLDTNVPLIVPNLAPPAGQCRLRTDIHFEWTTIEVSIAMSCACLPPIRVLLARWLPRSFDSDAAVPKPQWRPIPDRGEKAAPPNLYRDVSTLGTDSGSQLMSLHFEDERHFSFVQTREKELPPVPPSHAVAWDGDRFVDSGPPVLPKFACSPTIRMPLWKETQD